MVLFFFLPSYSWQITLERSTNVHESIQNYDNSHHTVHKSTNTALKKKKKKESVEGLYLEDKFSFSLVYISKVQILHKLHFINHYLTYQFIEILSIEDCWQNGPGKSSHPLQCDFPMLFTKKWDLFCFPSHLDLDI